MALPGLDPVALVDRMPFTLLGLDTFDPGREPDEVEGLRVSVALLPAVDVIEADLP